MEMRCSALFMDRAKPKLSSASIMIFVSRLKRAPSKWIVAGDELLRAARINARFVMLLDPGKLKSPDMGFRKGSMDKDLITVVKR